MNSALLYLKSFFQVLKLTDIIDIFLIAIIVYQLLKILKETRAMQLKMLQCADYRRSVRG